jgi:hypothetical protein
LRSGTSNAGIDPMTDHRPLEFRECAGDLEKQVTAWIDSERLQPAPATR